MQSDSLFEPAGTVLVTGAGGMIGRAVTEHLAQCGASLRLQVRDRIRFAELMAGKVDLSGAEILEADFEHASERDFARLVAGCAHVIHCAAQVHTPGAPFEAYELLNVRTTRQLGEAASAASVHTFLFLSTMAVYGQGPFEEAKEDDPLRPVTPYAVSKANSEDWLGSFSGFKRLLILRPALVFGEGDRGNMFKLIRQIKSGRYFHIGATPVRKSVIYCRDVARAVQLCLTGAPDGREIFNVANPSPVLLRELAELVAQALGRKGITTLPKPLVRLGAGLATALLKDRSPLNPEQVQRLTTSTTCSVDKLIRATGFAPYYALHEALANEIAWGERAGLL